MKEETLKTKIIIEDVYSVKNLTIESGATIDDTTYKVKFAEENVYQIVREPEKTAVKILMLKGEKGDSGGGGGGGGGGVGTYAELPDKPAINDVTLLGNKSLEDLNVKALTNFEIEELLSNN